MVNLTSLFNRKQPDLQQLIKQVVEHPQSAEYRNALTKAAKRDPVKVLTQIIQYQHSMYNKDVANWKMARMEAKDIEQPHRVLLTDLYEDIELDAFIYGIVHNKRTLKISNKPFKIVNSKGEEQREKTELFKHQWFNDFIKYAMQSRYYGHSLVYFYEWSNQGRILKTNLVPRRHVRPEFNQVVIQQYDLTGFDYSEPPFSNYIMPIGNPHDLGLYEKAALLYILKKHSWQSWDQFEERFGIPIPIVKTATTDKKVLDSIESWLRDLSTGSYGIIPDSGELTVVESGKTDAHQVFFKKIEMCQMELEVLFTGQIRETNKSGTYGKEKAKEDEAQEIVTDDKTFIANIINDHLIPHILIPNGYPLQQGDRFDWNDGTKLSAKDRLEIFTGVQKLGFKLDIKQVSEELDVKIEEAEDEPEDTDPKKKGNKDENDEKDQSVKQITNMHKAILNTYFNV